MKVELVGLAVGNFSEILAYYSITLVDFDALFANDCGRLVRTDFFVGKVTGVQATGACWRYVSEKEAEGQGE
jgi:hypothetical protein